MAHSANTTVVNALLGSGSRTTLIAWAALIEWAEIEQKLDTTILVLHQHQFQLHQSW